MDLLQAAGVPAGAVQDAADRLERDPQLAARHHFVPLASTEVGELPLEGVPFDLSATPPHTGGRHPPRAAGHRRGRRRRSCATLLELDDAEIAPARATRERCQ